MAMVRVAMFVWLGSDAHNSRSREHDTPMATFTKVCFYCKQEFEATHPLANICSPECQKRAVASHYHQSQPNTDILGSRPVKLPPEPADALPEACGIDLNCRRCGKVVQDATGTRRYCSSTCRKAVQRGRRRERLRRAYVEPVLMAELSHFLKVTRSYRVGLFKCYESSDLPRTNNDLEHAFGSHRYHERRASGRRQASPGLVVLGSARVISSLATRLRPEEGLVLRPGYVPRWQALPADLEARREPRRKQHRFRHDPASYLRTLEQRYLQLLLPA